MINKWILLGPANAKKAEIVMSALLANPIIKSKPFVFLCENESGCAIEFAKANKVEFYIINDLKLLSPKVIELLQSLNTDILISCGWNYKIPIDLNKYFKYPILNCHGSVLPDYKGKRAYVHQWANIENVYGATIHAINEKFDEGEIIIQGKLKLFIKENLVIIHRRISEFTAQLIPQALVIIENNLLTQSKYIEENVQSRYFYNTRKWKLIMHRKINRLANYFKISKWLTPHSKGKVKE